ncbi:MAG: hypothetical protein C5B59_03795 [Bacteroidetes bacterium]|nr:MAG: hypothetical protein C5B59_03795 [Bacteroidota bacterium]
MKKIIVAFDGLKYSKAAAEYAIDFAAQMEAHLVGVFLDDFSYHSYKIYELVHNERDIFEEKIEQFENKDKYSRDRAAEQFELACRDAAINHSIHHDKNIAIQEILHESIYADLIIVDGKETLTHYEEDKPTKFIRDLLINSECPIIVTPGTYKKIKKVVFLYDGGPSSVYAIKMFSYTLPQMKDLEVEVISVKEGMQTMHLSDGRLMKEFMKRHFPKAEYTILKGLADIEIIKHLRHKSPEELVVLGAYRRSTVSRWFKPSMADFLMQELRSPLFIAHNK